jgi:hypothetical protein
MGLFSELRGNAGVANLEGLNKDFAVLLTDGERIEIGFQIIRDVILFTNKRLIVINKQGLTGKKAEYLSIVYKSITRFSIETAGTFDLDAELKIWISSEQAPSIRRKFSTQVNIYHLQKVLAQHVLQ